MHTLVCTFELYFSFFFVIHNCKLVKVYNLVSTNRYPGGPLLNPLGLAKDIKSAREWKLKEIKNGIFFLSFSFFVC